MIKKWLLRMLDKLISRIVSRGMPLVIKNYNSMYSQKWHPHNAMRDEALAETVAYIKARMGSAMIKTDQIDVLTYASQNACLDGLVLEFGVRTGTTINHICNCKPDSTVYGFDSFEGLPAAWTGWSIDKGAFARDTLPDVKSNAELVKGWFDQTLPLFLAEHQNPVALVHIDSDIYASAKTVLDNLAPRVRPGTIIVFNEYFNYPNWKQHEFKAFQEFCQSFSVDYEYICWGHFEVAVKILAIQHKKDLMDAPEI